MFKHGFPPEWSTLKKLVWLVGSGIAGAAAGIWKTVSGSLIHITDALASPMQKCEVMLEPIQDLHGQDAPSPGTFTSFGTFEQGTINGQGDPTASDTRVRSQKLSVQSGTHIIEFDSDKKATVRVYDTEGTYKNAESVTSWAVSPITFTCQATRKLILVLATSNTTDTIVPSDVTRAGEISGQNICPITGWTGCEVWNDPKYGGLINWNQIFTDVSVIDQNNWRPYATQNGSVSYADNELTYTFIAAVNNAWGNGIDSTNFGMTKDHYVFISHDIYVPKSCKVNLCYFQGGIEVNADVGWNSFATIQKVNNTYESGVYNIFGIRNAQSAGFEAGDTYKIKNPMFIDLTEMFGAGNEPTSVEEFKALFPKDYYPYNAGEETTVSAVNGDPYQHLSVTFPDGQTVYSGTFDFVSGVGVLDMQIVDLSNLSWGGSGSTIFYTTDNFPNFAFAKTTAERGTGMLCSAYPFSTNLTYSAAMDDKSMLRGNAANLLVAIRNTDYANAADFKASLSGVQLLYPLAEPITFTLTPQQISTLKGENNVWSNGDSVEITYKAQA